MGLLDKFNNISITADNRISESDRKFCQAQKAAYDHARKSLKLMADTASDILDAQKALLWPVESEIYSTYLGKFDPNEFTEALHASHKHFISRVFLYFRNKYNVTISEHDAEEILLPKKPEYSYGWSQHDKSDWKEYHRALDDLSLDYSAILDQIFIQLGGYSFQDKAVQELKEASRSAAWNDYSGTKNYEQKKAVLSFPNYFCSFDSWHEQYYHGEHQIKLTDKAKNVIRAILHFEYGNVKNGYTPLDVLLGYDWKTEDTELPVRMEKLKSIKCFKNGRVDFRFTSETYAREFALEYLER